MKPEMLAAAIKLIVANFIRDNAERFRGPRGKDGAHGINGSPGERGAKGERGGQGERGMSGARGETGPRGMDGRNGKDGKDGSNGRDADPVQEWEFEIMRNKNGYIYSVKARPK